MSSTEVGHKTSKQGSIQPFDRVEGPDAWYASDFKNRTDWIHRLSKEEIQQLDTAVAHASALSKEIKDITKEDFQLGSLAATLEDIQKEVSSGRGFAIIKGVPVDRYSRKEQLVAYWGLGLYWGKVVPTNQKGHLVGHVKDIGANPNNPTTRLYATNAAQPWHNDSSDIVGLLCLQQAKEGGLSSFSSSISVYNELLSQHPDVVPLLAARESWFYDRKNEVPEGKLPYFEIPVLNFHEGYLSINFSDNYYYLSQRHPEVPRLTELHIKAINAFNEIAGSDKLRMDYLLEAGDIELLNNHVALHTRSSFIDDDALNRRRHLLRLWLSPSDDRPLPAVYKDLYGGSVAVGNRGGIRCDGKPLTVPLEADQ